MVKNSAFNAQPDRPSLFQAVTSLEDLEAKMLDEETSEEELAAAAAQLLEASEDVNEAIKRLCYVIQKLEIAQQARLAASRIQRDLAADIKRLSDTDGSRVRQLKRRIFEFMEDRGLSKLEAGIFKVGVRSNGGNAPLELEDFPETEVLLQHPECFKFSVAQPENGSEPFPQKLVELLAGIAYEFPDHITVDYNSAVIASQLREEKDLPFARLGERGRSLTIRPAVKEVKLD